MQWDNSLMRHRGRQKEDCTRFLSLQFELVGMYFGGFKKYGTHTETDIYRFSEIGACFELPDPVHFGSGTLYSISKARKCPIPCFRELK